MAYDRISDEKRAQIPTEHRCPVSYNGFHVYEVVKENLQATPIMVCTKCGKIKLIDWSVEK